MENIPDTLESPESIDRLLGDLWRELNADIPRRIGYQGNFRYDYEELSRFWSISIVNAGDPYFSRRHKVKTYAIERACIDWFARLYAIEDHWGYFASCGSEANLHGLFLGREMLPDAQVYYSAESHYSVTKAAKILRIDTARVDALASGEMCYESLVRRLKSDGGRPAILHLNIGTTMHGAIDDIARVVDLLNRQGVDYYIHCDAALAGMMLPFIEGAPQIDFSALPIGSVSVSGHKFIGTPIPCGIFLTRREHATSGLFNDEEIQYIKSVDSTVSGTRNGLAPLFIWSALCKRGEVFRDEVATCLRLAQSLYEQLDQRGYCPLLNEHSSTVVFERPSDEVCGKWQLMTRGRLAHVVVMQHVTEAKLQEFLRDLPDRSTA